MMKIFAPPYFFFAKVTRIFLICKKFNYEIPIAEVEYAGIDSKGASCENQLIPLAKEYTEYRIKNKLWETKDNSVTYKILEDNLVRINIDGEEEVFYSKNLKG